MLRGFLEFISADPAIMIRFHEQQNLPRECGLINPRSDGARLILIAGPKAKNPRNVDLRGRRVARQRDNRNADLVRDLLSLMRDIAVRRGNQRRNPLFGDQLDHFAAGLAPLFRLVAYRERQVTPVRERPRSLFLRQRHVRGFQQRLAFRRICALKRKEQSDLHRCALKIGSVFPAGPAISDGVAVESCIGSLRSDFILGRSRIGERSHAQKQQRCESHQECNRPLRGTAAFVEAAARRYDRCHQGAPAPECAALDSRRCAGK